MHFAHNTMIVCLAVFNNRLAAVFDSAERFVLYHIEEGAAHHTGTIPVTALSSADKTTQLSQHDVSMLICGALCGCDRRMVQQAGITVEPWICGTIPNVITALCQGELASLRMPGCTHGCGQQPRSAQPCRHRRGKQNA